MHAFCDRDSRNSLSLSVVGTATFKPLPAQAPLGNWLPPVQFPDNGVGCGGNPAESFYAVHASLIPVGPHRGKVLIWDPSAALVCSLVYGFSGDRDQRWAIVDPESGTVIFDSWKILAAAAPPIFAPIPAIPTLTNGVQGLFCASHCWLPDGRLLVVGGDDWSGEFSAGYAKFTGSRLVCIYDPMPTTANPGGTWSTVAQLLVPVPFLTVARWYPTVVVTYLPNAAGTRSVKVVVLGGIEQYVEEPYPDTLIGNGIFLSTDRAYLTHEAYDLTAGATSVTPWTISKDDLRPGGTLPANYMPNAPVNGLFVGPETSATLPDFRLGFSLFYYARAHYLSDGVFGGGTPYANGLTWVAGMATGAAWVNHPVDPNMWALPHPIITTSYPLLDEPTGVLLPASLLTSLGVGEDRIALFGGEYGVLTGLVSRDVHVLGWTAAFPSWSTTAIPPMNHARKFPNALVLPDRSVLVTGGEDAGAAVTKPEVFRGAATGWQDGPVEASPRAYHSILLQLSSGRAVTMGGDTRTKAMQVFEPHYFQPGNTRPVITSPSPTAVATVIGYNSTFPVTFTLASGRTLQSASLTTPGSLTHGHDPNQRLVELGIDLTSLTTTSATLTTPVNPTKAPYGNYMLWLVDSAGEVSVAAWVQLW